MDIESIFRLVTTIIFFTTLSVGGYFRRKAEHEGGPMRSHEGSRLVVVLRILGLIVILPLFGYFINPQWVTWAQMPLPVWLRWSGAVTAALMIPLIAWMFLSIGSNITATQATRQNHKLVTSGPYRWIRHPLYTFGFIFACGITCLSALWWLGVGMIPPMIILMLRTSIEEARLIEAFGDDYRNYMKRTGRFFPKFA
ncbi:MAG: isoprenylcysteine carboxylmethyltransferase family protein [Chloroflexi bacterium]|nr:isoprenylcysteine carboxylmethyltransferase family protein [Chloroflexota bacterium]